MRYISRLLVSVFLFLSPLHAAEYTAGTKTHPDLLWIAQANQLTAYSLFANEVRHQFALDGIDWMATDPATGKLWLGIDDELAFIEADGSISEPRVPAPADAASTNAVVIDGTRRVAWLASGDTLYRLSADLHLLIDTVSLPNVIDELVLDESGGKLFVLSDGGVIIIGLQSGAQAPLQLTGFGSIEHIALDREARNLWLASASHVIALDKTLVPLIAPVPHDVSPLKYLVADTTGGAWIAGTHELVHVNADGFEITRSVPFDDTAGGGSGNASRLRELMPYPHGDLVWIANNKYVRQIDGTGARSDVFQLPGSNAAIKLAVSHHDITAPEIWITRPTPELYTNDNRPHMDVVYTDYGSTVATDSLVLALDDVPQAITCQSTLQTALCIPDVAIPDGYYELSATIDDLAANTSEPDSLHFTVDTVPPEFRDIEPADGLITNQKTLPLTGRVNEPAEVTVGVSPVAVSTDLGFATRVSLVEGTNVITLRATDRANNATMLDLDYVLDTVPPVIELQQPAQGTVLSNSEISIVGTVNENSAIKVNGVEISHGSTPERKFTTNIQGVEGENQIVVTAIDLAGNVSSVIRTLSVDTTPPEPPNTAAIGISIENGVATISGGAGAVEPDVSIGAFVMQYLRELFNLAPLAETISNEDGSFSFSFDVPSGVDNIDIVITDANGNSSSASLDLTLPREAATLVGTIPGSANVTSTGNASYTVPIDLPPGPGGLTPSLALVYSSGSGFGLMGQGWTISEVAPITRCGSIPAREGIRKGVRMDDGDNLCQGGVKLVPYSRYGNTTVYRKEIEDGTRVHGFRETSGQVIPSYFRVDYPDGRWRTFGATPDSRHEFNGLVVRSWALSAEYDHFGNQIQYRYHASRTNGLRPDSIQYGSTEIKFAYESRQDVDIVERYSHGQSVKQPFRLSSLTIKNDPQEFSRWQFRYLEEGLTHIDKLGSIQRCRQSECTSSTLTTWRTVSDNFKSAQLMSEVADAEKGPWLIDVTQDDVLDILFKLEDDNWWYYAGITNGRFVHDKRILRKDYDYATTMRTTYFDTDPYKDLVVHGGTGSTHVYAGKPDGGFGNVLFADYQRKGWLADHNGDGLDDFIELETEGNVTSVLVQLNNDGELNAAESAGSVYAVPSPVVIYDRALGEVLTSRIVRDFNRDGRADILLRVDSGVEAPPLPDDPGDICDEDRFLNKIDCDYDPIPTTVTPTAGWVLLMSEPEGIVKRSLYVPHYRNPVVGDFNGDGIDDLAYHFADWKIQFGTGAGFAPPVSTGVTHRGNDARALAMDFDRDGLDDIILPSDSGTRLLRSSGNGFHAAATISLPANDDLEYRVVDLNLDGLDDLMYRDGDKWKHLAGRGIDRERMVSVDAGFGNKTEWVYEAQSNPLVHETLLMAEAAGDLRPYNGIRHIVKEMRRNDGTGGIYNLRYTYGGAAYDRLGRGFSGYATQRIADSRSALTQVIEREQKFPLTGRTRSAALRSAWNVNVEETTTDWFVRAEGAGRNQRYVVYPRISQTATHDNTGATLSISQRSLSDVDTNGNPGSIVEKTYNPEDFNGKNSVPLLVSRTEIEYFSSHQCSAVPTRVKSARYRSTPPKTWQEVVNVVDSATCRIDRSTRAPATLWQRVTDFEYDVYGNLKKTTASGAGAASRTTRVTYDATGRYPEIVRDALGVETRVQWHKPYAEPRTVTTPAGATVYSYDPLGRLVTQTTPDNVTTRLERSFCNSACSAERRTVERQYRVDPNGSEQLLATQWLDEYGRVTDQRTAVGELSGAVRSHLVYDKLGRLIKESLPHLPGSDVHYRVTEYDVLGRPTRTYAPRDEQDQTGEGWQQRYDYIGRELVLTDAESRVTRYRHDALGRVTSIKDAKGQETSYGYHNLGGLREITGPDGATTSIQYDAYGRRTVVNDAALGVWQYPEYTAFDEPKKIRDPKGQEAIHTYGLLGRLTSLSTPDGTTRWQYANTGGGTGQVKRIEGPAGDITTFAYDTLGRLSNETLAFQGEDHRYDYTYDALSRLDTITYPETFGLNGDSAAQSRLKVRYAYDALGNTTHVTNANNPNESYWHSTTRDFLGRSTKARLGNGLTATAEWDRISGFIKQLGVNNISGINIHGNAYQWSAAGNLNERLDTVTGHRDIFHYDALDRLTDVYENSDQNPPVANTRYHHDGRIKTRSGNPGITGNTLGTYSYNTTNAFELASTSGLPSPLNAFDHDELGNATQWRGLDVQWDAANRLTRIDNSTSGDWLTLIYGASGERLIKEQQLNGHYRKLERWGALTERLTQTLPSGSLGTTWRHRIVIEGEIKTVVVRDGAGDSTHYLHRDHLGSLTAISDNFGSLVAERKYSEWGETRNANATIEATFLAVTDENYTGQEHLAFGLLHYNGRVYDTIVGQFLSTDPFIANPFDPQNANRRSYVMNNPMKYTDPSGFIVSCDGSKCEVSAPQGGGGFDPGWANFISGGDGSSGGGGGAGGRGGNQVRNSSDHQSTTSADELNSSIEEDAANLERVTVNCDSECRVTTLSDFYEGMQAYFADIFRMMEHYEALAGKRGERAQQYALRADAAITLALWANYEDVVLRTSEGEVRVREKSIEELKKSIQNNKAFFLGRQVSHGLSIYVIGRYGRPGIAGGLAINFGLYAVAGFGRALTAYDGGVRDAQSIVAAFAGGR